MGAPHDPAPTTALILGIATTELATVMLGTQELIVPFAPAHESAPTTASALTSRVSATLVSRVTIALCELAQMIVREMDIATMLLVSASPGSLARTVLFERAPMTAQTAVFVSTGPASATLVTQDLTVL